MLWLAGVTCACKVLITVCNLMVSSKVVLNWSVLASLDTSVSIFLWATSPQTDKDKILAYLWSSDDHFLCPFLTVICWDILSLIQILQNCCWKMQGWVIQHPSGSSLSFQLYILYDWSYVCSLWDNVTISLWSKILKKQGMADLCTVPLHVIILTVSSQLIAVWILSVLPSSNR